MADGTPAIAAPQNAGAAETTTMGRVSHLESEPSSDSFLSMLEAGTNAGAPAPTPEPEPEAPIQSDGWGAKPASTETPAAAAAALPGADPTTQPDVAARVADVLADLAEPATGEALESQMTHARKILTDHNVPKDLKEVLLKTFFANRDVSLKTGFKTEDIRLIHEAGFTPKRALETLRMFPTDEDAKVAQRESMAFRQVMQEYATHPDAFLGNLSATNPNAFRGVVDRVADALEQVAPEKYVALYSKANAQFLDIVEQRATEENDSDLAVAAQLLREKAFPKQEQKPAAPANDPTSRKLAEYEARERQFQEQQAASMQQHSARFEQEVISRTAKIAGDDIMKMLAERLPKDEFTQDEIKESGEEILKAVQRDFLSNPTLVNQIQNLMANGPQDRNHLTQVLTYAIQRIRPLIAPRAASHIEAKTRREREKQAARESRRAPVLARVDPVVSPVKAPAPPPPDKLAPRSGESWHDFLNRATGVA